MIHFDSINVNVIDTTSGIFTGTNHQMNWRTQSKTNSGFGTVEGQNNVIIKPVNTVIDPDTTDNPYYNNNQQ
ncbi:hypothetical protein [Tuberibacillus sp. Marseille-P3662]|uniref:hypothetical protein n=1 Tax=Tuberibacillus sp. Marseille-P3662 TaxID=1965358 RepID=UPI000A1C9F1A|nr:hypothetical protein [Tuberibacillus sp. Marseille-P3662]